MALTAAIHDLIRVRAENVLTSGEFSMRMLQNLQEMPVAARQAALEELLAHADEDVRDVASECRLLLRHQELSRDPDYVRQHSPLRPGVRLELSGGYDEYDTDGGPWWLDGRDCYKATFLDFASRGENTIPAALVVFDDVIERPRHKGRYGVLLASHSADSVAWVPTEDVVIVYVTEAQPDDVSAFRFDGRAVPDPIETHATYRVEQPT